MSSKEVCLVTPHAVHNYGAMLQAYALGWQISSLGYDVSYYDFPPHHRKKAHSLRELAVTKLAMLLKWWYQDKVALKNSRFDEFARQFKPTTAKDLPCYVVGSDQVWHPYNLDETFSLAFVAEESLKFSYAASLGVSHVAEPHEAKFRQALERLAYLSSREPDGAREAERLTGRHCGVHIDPTFLLTQEEWSAVEHPVDGLDESYILLYLLYVPKDINDLIAQVRKRFSRTVYVIDMHCYLHLLVRGCKPVIEVGPREFVWLIHHADLVVTSSFHGLAFSLIFERQFLPLVNPSFPSRMANLLQLVNLECDFRNPLAFLDSPIDYSFQGKPLESEIAKSREYLRECLLHIPVRGS